MNKKGVSNIIATILIILVVVAAVAVTWLFVLSYFEEEIMTGENVRMDIETSGGFTFWA
jgi:flagellin-like protein